MGILYSEPMCQAAYDDDIHKLQKLISADPKNVNVQDEGTGDTPIIAACRRGHLRTVKYLLDYKANVSIRNKKERTCLHYATRRTFSFLDYLMIAILMPILLIGYLIMEEKQRKNVKLMELLLATKVEVNAVDYKGNTGLHYACQRKSQRIIPLLLEKNADVSVQNKVKMNKVVTGDRDVALYLAANHSLMSAENLNHETPLDIAKRLQFHKIVTMLTKSM